MLSFPRFKPTTTVPGYVLAKVIYDGPNVREAGASTGFATLYVTYAEEAASYVARSLVPKSVIFLLFPSWLEYLTELFLLIGYEAYYEYN